MGWGAERSLLDRGLDAFTAKRWRKARELLEDAEVEEHPQPAGDYHLGLLYWRGLGGGRDREGAVHYFRRAAGSGHAGAQTALALAIESAGASSTETRSLLRSAAGGGDVTAMTRLAEVSEHTDAQRLLQRAADAGHPPAMPRLSDLLMEDDAVESLAWLYVHVAQASDDQSYERAKRLADEMSAEEIDAAERRAKSILKRFRQEHARR